MAVEISLAQFNRIASSEHACVNFALSKDENTGGRLPRIMGCITGRNLVKYKPS